MSEEINIAEQIELSIVLPCLNEERTVETCIEKAKISLEKNNITGEVIIADNGSTDHSIEIALSHGATVIHVSQKGYGSALRGGFDAARGKYIIMADADDSYELDNLTPFVEKLREGFDLVMGNRFKGGIRKGAMPWHHQYIGNPVLSFIGQLFFKTPAKDFHCGLRGFTKSAIKKMDLQTTGMELASEIVIKSSILDLKVCEIPTILSKDGRGRPPHLHSFRDGWRHLRFLLLYNPRWLFLYPSIILICFGLLSSGILFSGPIVIGNITLDIGTLLYSSALIILGFQLLVFALFANKFAVSEKLLPEHKIWPIVKMFNLEKGLLISLGLMILGIFFSILALSLWKNFFFGPLIPSVSLRLIIPGVTLFIIGFQMLFSSFFLSILTLRSKGIQDNINWFEIKKPGKSD